MTRIFAAVTLATVMLISTAAMHSAFASSGADNESLDNIAAMFSTGIEVSALLPIVLLVALLIAGMGVLARA